MKLIKATAAWLFLLALMALAPGFTLHASIDCQDLEPGELLEQTASVILETLDQRREEFVENPEALRDMVRAELLPVLDLTYSARLILGRAGRGISDEQLQAFADAMSTVLVQRYSDGLLEFESNDQLEILPLKGKQTDKLTRVKTRVRLPSGDFAPVDYAFRKTEKGWKAFDVTVEGISYVITYRNQIAPMVEKDGIDKVTADLAAGSVTLNDE